MSTQVTSQKLSCPCTCVMLFFNYTLFMKPQSYIIISHAVILNVHDYNNSRSIKRSDLAPDVSVNRSVLTVNSVRFSRPMDGFFPWLTMFYYIVRQLTHQGIQEEVVMVSLKFFLFHVIGVYFPQYKGESRGLEMVQGGDGAGVHTSYK